MSFTRFKSRSRDIQDGVERGMWGSLAYVEGSGASLSIRGTGTLDEEVPLMNIGYGFNLPSNYNAEMIMLSLGADVNDKVAIATLPRDLQHPWGESEGGVQHPTNPARRMEYNATETWLKDGEFAYGDDKPKRVTIAGNDVTVTLAGNRTITIAGDDTITVQGGVTINVLGDTTVSTTGTTNLTSGGDMTINAPNVEITGNLTNNGTNVGNTHTHGGVTTGGGNTAGPN